MKRLIHCLQTVAALLLLTFLAGCEKPRLKSQGQEPEETEPGVVAEEGAKVPIEKPESREMPPPVTAPPKAAPKIVVNNSASETPKMSLEERARQIAAKEEMLKAQHAGILSLESDPSRRTEQLNELRQQLQVAKAKQSRGRGGVMVEMIDGKSSKVGDASAVRELQGKVSNEEQLVEQLSKALARARQDYAALSAEVQRLRGGP